MIDKFFCDDFFEKIYISVIIINIIILTTLMSSGNRLGRLAGFTRSGLVDSDNAEFVFRSLVKILHRERCIRSRIVVDFEPFATPFASFHVISCIRG